ncbi:unnamed protein product [Acanthoscelides obtectus]|uniref:RNase H type-1 domain-containing protein n=1 Tax=Acanthoscelides obtectus TaxID=200917 RepID=A0A9P0PF96_ACAOB|nr:unnamed protein product [Acanthoscelides obtectus]CAK1642708.1 hypothetical protein AOBTE_LOCUS13175 [Acanthoscelides obtectus]
MICKVWWGSDQKIAILFFRSYVRSILDYGSIFYGSASKNLLHVLDITQNKFLRKCLGAMQSSPVGPLRAEAQEPPLHLRRQMLSSRFLLKVQHADSHLLSKIHRLNTMDLTCKYWTKRNSPPLCSAIQYANRIQLTSHSQRLIQDISYFHLLSGFDVRVPAYKQQPHHIQNLLREVQSKLAGDVFIYTDASKSESGTGCAHYIPSIDIFSMFKLPNEFTIFSAEAIAIFQALQFVEDHNLGNTSIFSDSLSVVSSLKNGSPFDMQNIHLFNIRWKISQLKQRGLRITLVWVKAHSGIIHNEKADDLAKMSITSGTKLDIPLSMQDNRVILKGNLLKRWRSEWIEYCFTNPTRYNLIHPSLPRGYWHENFKIPRKYISCITRAKIGHGVFPSHLARLNLVPSALCDVCEVYGDLDHCFFGCAKFLDHCNALYSDLVKSGISAPLNTSHVFSLGRSDVIILVVKFIRNSGIKI